jgi:hypothetical protein
MRTAITPIILAAVLSSPGAASAQPPQPLPPLPIPAPEDRIGPFVVDLRGSLPVFGQDAQIAETLGLSPGALPSFGLGLTVGGHVYAPRTGPLTFGAGAELLWSRGRRSPPDADSDAAQGPDVETSFSALSPQASINFGRGAGWSYLSGGLGWGRFSVERADAPPRDSPGRTKTINYGGGARWFIKPHLAFSLDLRFYAVDASADEAGAPLAPSQTLLVINVGASFK